MNDETRLYVMVTKTGETVRHFKIGITRNLSQRLRAVQNGCPTPITSVMSVILPNRCQAERAEKEMHGLLEPYHLNGEWFAFDMSNLTHKAAFNGAARMVLDRQLGPGWVWSVADLKKVRNMLADVRPKAQRMAYEARVAHAYRMVNGLPMW
jgi:hypothetical protein